MSFNLTGRKRIVHDCCLDIYNSVQKWKSIVIQGHHDFLHVCVLQQKEILLITRDAEESQHNDQEKFLEQLCENLEEKISSLRNLAAKMEKVATKINSLQSLTDSTHSITEEKDYIPFQIWPLSKFCSVIEEIAIMFQDDIKLKEIFFKEVCFLSDKQQLSFFEACWKYQPNIDQSKLDRLLGGIICELDLFSEVS